MAKKLYLSAAAHQYDNSTKCPMKCGENVHCKSYMDIVEKRMREHGVEVKRGFQDQVGDIAMKNRVAEANAWGADLYYVAHTNSGGGRYTLTLCWGNQASRDAAAVIGKYRKSITPHKVAVRTNLYEIRATNMICLYDELFFHDNAEDCAWFHNGGMEIMAEETVQALCEQLDVTYKAPNNTNAKVKELEAKVKELEARVKTLQSDGDSLKKTIAALTNKINKAKADLA